MSYSQYTQNPYDQGPAQEEGGYQQVREAPPPPAHRGKALRPARMSALSRRWDDENLN